MEDRRVHYTVVGTFESAHSAALWQVELLARGVTAHVWPNADLTSNWSKAWFVIVPDDQADRAEVAKQAMAAPQLGKPAPIYVVVNGTAT